MLTSFVFMAKNNYTQILLILIAFDFITGFSKAYLWKVADSWVGLKGFVKHSVTFLLYFFIGAFCHSIQNFGLGQIFLIIICLNYALSIIENVGVMGVYVPNFVKVKISEEIARYEKKLEKGENKK